MENKSGFWEVLRKKNSRKYKRNLRKSKENLNIYRKVYLKNGRKWGKIKKNWQILGKVKKNLDFLNKFKRKSKKLGKTFKKIDENEKKN